MRILENISLKPFNTFGLDETAEYFFELQQEEELNLISAEKRFREKKVLGGGSNILITRPVSGLVIHNCLKGISIAEENEQHIWLEVKAGEVWHNFVMYAINNQWGGIENLSLIPGKVGAAPMQNIGAYGVEVKDLIDEVVAWHWEEQAWMVLKNEDCKFGYRDSIFKQALKDKAVITSVTFRLHKIHALQTSYGAIRQQLDKMGVSEPSIKNISEAVIAIRSSKLPDPKKTGNAGSFFKNPTVTKSVFENLKLHHPDIPVFPLDDCHVKISAAWLIETCGWKGFREGGAGVHQQQALVLVNAGNATGNDIWNLSERILESVEKHFGITLEREVQRW